MLYHLPPRLTNISIEIFFFFFYFISTKIKTALISTEMLESIQKHFAIIIAQCEKTTVRREIQCIDDLHFFIVKFREILVDC